MYSAYVVVVVVVVVVDVADVVLCSFFLLLDLGGGLYERCGTFLDRLRTIIAYDRICVLDAGQIVVRFYWSRPPFSLIYLSIYIGI